MANITKSNLGLQAAITQIELTGADTLGSTTGTLYLRNDTLAEVTVNILGDGATTYVCSDVGEIDLTGGYDVVLAADALVAVPLKAISAYLAGDVVDVTGGEADVFAFII